MSSPRPVGPQDDAVWALPIIGLMTSEWDVGVQLTSQLAATYGGIASWGEKISFAETDYYAPEMGPHLFRGFCSCSKIFHPDELREFKQHAWRLEQEFTRDGHRRVNLDPGYIDFGKVVLASFKTAPHKLYLGAAIWADVVLLFKNGAFTPLPWTFPDLISSPHVAFFTAARSQFKSQLASGTV